MSALTRRNALTLFFTSTASAAMFAAAGAAFADGPGYVPPTKTPDRAKVGDVRRALTPGDNAMHKRCISKTMGEAPTGKTWAWKNPKTGNHGTVTPTSKAERIAGKVCRNFNETITLHDGRSETIDGHACRNPDGSWDMAG